MLSRRSATTLAMLVALNEAARADTPPPAGAPPVAPAPVPKPAAKPAVEALDKDQALAILGRPVTGAEGQEIGRLTDVLVDGTGQPQAAVLDIGGFMGLGSRSIAVHWNLLHFTPTDPKAPIKLALSLDQIKAMPEYKGIENKPAPVVVRSDVKPAPAH
ncbi:MAG: PRC-barrel domain-containing protein [Acetobacteraceae bacterium]